MKILVCGLAILTIAAGSVIPQNGDDHSVGEAESISNKYIAPVLDDKGEVVEEPIQDSAFIVDDGYQYKTIQRLKARSRRDVSEIVTSKYLPPSEEDKLEIIEEANENSLSSSEYLPPSQSTEADIDEEASEDASKSLAPEYLPPSLKSEDDISINPVQDSAVLGDDGYQYKTVRRLKYRSRRDVSEIVPPKYLPPTEPEIIGETSEDSSISLRAKYLPPAPESESNIAEEPDQLITKEAVDEASKSLAPEYLPPADIVEEPVQDSAVLDDDGYQYKTVRRLKYRTRRDVSEVVPPKYLPPTERDKPEITGETSEDSSIYLRAEYLPPASEADIAEKSAQDPPVLGADGYQYKTVRRLRYRSRRDV